jgi:hypothetical protein
MVEEFGLDNTGDIDCDAAFVTDMRDLCGQEIEIEEIKNSWDSSFKKIQDIDGWSISFDMIEEI